MKLPNSTGTVYKMSGKRRKPWAAVITTGWTQYFDDDGVPLGKPKQERKFIGSFATRKDALKALMDWNEQSSTPTQNPSVSAQKQGYTPTFKQLWKEVKPLRVAKLAKTTQSNYEYSFKRCEAFHDKRVDTITYSDLQKNMNDYMAEGKTAGSLKLHKVFLTMIFNEAIKQGYISQNPASLVTYKATKDKTIKDALPIDIIKRIYESDCPTRDAVIILIYTGIRINELLSLKHIEDDHFVVSSKTEAGNRTVPIHPQVKDLLERWVSVKHSKYGAFSKQLDDDCEVYGYKFTFHECRHTFVSLATKYDMNEIIMKKIVGHSTNDVTEKVYTHVDVPTLIEQINKIPMINDLS